MNGRAERLHPGADRLILDDAVPVRCCLKERGGGRRADGLSIDRDHAGAQHLQRFSRRATMRLIANGA